MSSQLRPGITVVVTTIPERAQLLGRAVTSVQKGTVLPHTLIVASDVFGVGAAITRTRGLEMVDTEWVAFLDDDDEFGEHHLQRLMEKQIETGADMVFPWFYVMGGSDPFPDNFGREFDLADPHQTTVTVLVRTEAALAVNGFLWEDGTDPLDPGQDEDGNRAGEEFHFAIKLARSGYKIAHLPERTWTWHHWMNGGQIGNTMGLPSRRAAQGT